MLDFTLQELSDIVEKIQYEIFDKTDDEGYFISISTNGDQIHIDFLDICIWNNEDDMRDFDEENDCWEPMDGYLRRMINTEIRKISEIRL